MVNGQSPKERRVVLYWGKDKIKCRHRVTALHPGTLWKQMIQHIVVAYYPLKSNSMATVISRKDQKISQTTSLIRQMVERMDTIHFCVSIGIEFYAGATEVLTTLVAFVRRVVRRSGASWGNLYGFPSTQGMAAHFCAQS